MKLHIILILYTAFISFASAEFHVFEKKSKKYGVFDDAGKELMGVSYENYSPVQHQGKLIMWNNLEDIEIFTNKSRTKINLGYLKIDDLSFMYYAGENLFVLSNFDEYILVNIDNKKYKKFESVVGFFSSKKNIIVLKGGKWCLLNSDFSIALTLKVEDMASGFESDDIAVYRSNNKSGFINENGNKLTPPRFLFAYPPIKGVGIVSLVQNRYTLCQFTNKGIHLGEKKYRKILPPNPLSDSILVQSIDTHKWGAVSKNGDCIIKPLYDWISCMKNGHCLIKNNNKVFLWENGQIKKSSLPDGALLSGFSPAGYIFCKTEKEFGYVNVKGDWVFKRGN